MQSETIKWAVRRINDKSAFVVGVEVPTSSIKDALLFETEEGTRLFIANYLYGAGMPYAEYEPVPVRVTRDVLE